jgi:aryl carrier-like protein
MIPGAYIPVDQIPMTTTNKTDRRALRELGNAQTMEGLAELQSHGQKHREPSTEMEKRLQVLWSSVLGVEPASISADSNFLRIGGESIAAMRLVAAARLQSLSLTVAQIFKAPRLSQLALLVTQKTEEDEALQPQPAFSFLKTNDRKTFLQNHVEPFLYGNAGIVKDVIPCTDFQKCAVIDALQDPPGRLPIWIFGLPHNVDFARLEWACRALVNHFDILHAVFIQADGRFWQVLLEGFKPVYDTLDVDDDVGSFTRILCEEDLKRPRQLGRSFIRFMAIRHQAGKHRLVFRIAHAQFDGYTWGMMIQTLAALYHQQSLPMQPTFRQFIVFNERKKEQSLPYWTSRLRNYCHPSWSPASRIDAVYSTSDRMTASTSFQMPNVQRHEGISGATFFHAACAIALSQQFGQEDVVFGRLVTGRSMLPGSLQNVVGPTMTEVPIIASISPNNTIVAVAQQLQAQFIDDSAHESAGMEEIIRNCTDWPEQVVDFGWRTAFQQEDEMEFKFLDSGSTITVHEHDLLPRGRPEIYATPRNGRLHLEFEGNRRLISEDTVREVFARIQSVLGEV